MGTVNSSYTICGANEAQITAEIEKFNAAHAAAGVKAQMGVVDGNSVTVTFTCGNNVQTINLSILPEIDEPEGDGDNALTLRELAETMENMATTLQQSVSTKRSVYDVITDIYQLILLMMKTAKQQSQVAAEITRTSHQVLAEQALAQSELMVKEAMKSFKFGLASAIISSSGQLAGMIVSGIGYGKQIQSKFGGDPTKAQTQLTDLNKLKEDLNSGNKPGTLTADQMKQLGLEPVTPENCPDGMTPDQANYEVFKKEYMPNTVEAEKAAQGAWNDVEQQQKIVEDQQTHVNDLKKDVSGLRDGINKDETRLTELKDLRDTELKQKAEDQKAQNVKDKTTQLDNAQKAYDELGGDAKLNELKAKDPAKLTSNEKGELEKLQKAQNEVVVAQGELEDAKKAELTPGGESKYDEEIGKLEKSIPEKKSQLAAKESELQKAEEDFGKAKFTLHEKQVKFAESLKDVDAAKMKDIKNVDDKSGEAQKSAENAAKKSDDIGDKNKNVDKEGNKARTLSDKKLKQMIKRADTSVCKTEAQIEAASKGFDSLIENTKANLDGVLSRMQRDPDFKRGESLSSLGQSVAGLCNSFGQIINTFKEKNKALTDAEIKKIDSENELTRAALDEMRDLETQSHEDFRMLLSMLKQCDEALSSKNWFHPV